jgi:hypothetical protein
VSSSRPRSRRHPAGNKPPASHVAETRFWGAIGEASGARNRQEIVRHREDRESNSLLSCRFGLADSFRRMRNFRKSFSQVAQFNEHKYIIRGAQAEPCAGGQEGAFFHNSVVAIVGRLSKTVRCRRCWWRRTFRASIYHEGLPSTPGRHGVTAYLDLRHGPST